jgi:hypothetical protein
MKREASWSDTSSAKFKNVKTTSMKTQKQDNVIITIIL